MERIDRARRALAEAQVAESGVPRNSAADMVDAAIERARRAVSEAQVGASAAATLSVRVQAAIAAVEQPERTIITRRMAELGRDRLGDGMPGAAVRTRAASQLLTSRRLMAEADDDDDDNSSGSSGSSLEEPSERRRRMDAAVARRASAAEATNAGTDNAPAGSFRSRRGNMLTHANRTLDLMRERASMLQLVLELSRQELELNLQRMRMEEELQLAVALSQTMTDEVDKPKCVSPDRIEACAPQRIYAAAVSNDRKLHGALSTLPGGGECAICQAVLRPTETVRLLHCRHAFHVACIDNWLSRSDCCPLCRSNVEVEVEGKKAE